MCSSVISGAVFDCVGLIRISQVAHLIAFPYFLEISRTQEWSRLSKQSEYLWGPSQSWGGGALKVARENINSLGLEWSGFLFQKVRPPARRAIALPGHLADTSHEAQIGPSSHKVGGTIHLKKSLGLKKKGNLTQRPVWRVHFVMSA